MHVDKQASKRALDVETILKQAADGLDDDSIASSAFAVGDPLGSNKLPLPEPLDP